LIFLLEGSPPVYNEDCLTLKEFMTIDERLDRLTERHEALTQSVELLLRESQEHTRQITAQTGQINEHTRQVVALRDASSSLLQIVQLHENRISGLEGQR
jgi:hypothetical protein